MNLKDINKEFFSTEIEPNLATLDLGFGDKYKDIFTKLNNSTLEETIQKCSYIKLQETVYKNYEDMLNLPIGEFLAHLKKSKDTFYKQFLNPNGNLKYIDFYLKNQQDYTKKGVYFYFVGKKLYYIGRCKDSMKQRINSGYGHITPKNCYKDGQTTNCKMNAFVLENKRKINLKIYVMDNDKQIEEYEEKLIKTLKPPLNVMFLRKSKKSIVARLIDNIWNLIKR